MHKARERGMSILLEWHRAETIPTVIQQISYSLYIQLVAEVSGVVQKAKEHGDFLLVGLHTDEDVSERRGLHLPIMDLHERCLSVLACKYVDEVIIGGPLHLCCSRTCSMSR